MNKKKRNRIMIVVVVVVTLVVVMWSLYEATLPLELQLALMG